MASQQFSETWFEKQIKLKNLTIEFCLKNSPNIPNQIPITTRSTKV